LSDLAFEEFAGEQCAPLLITVASCLRESGRPRFGVSLDSLDDESDVFEGGVELAGGVA
jgi:hypothetical protein